MLFSIITINYNNREGLQKTINSVISQTFTDYEWIIIDGGSTDGSKELIEKYSKHLAYWCSEPDKGVYNAMNKGISKAKGDYINFMNSGDVFYDHDTLKNVATLQPSADIVYGDWLRVYSDHVVFMAAPHDVDILSFYQKNTISHQAIFIKRELHIKELYDERYRIYADWALWKKMSLTEATFQYIPLTICRYEAGTGISEQQTERKTLESLWLEEVYTTRIKKLAEDNIKLKDELKLIGPIFRQIFIFRHKKTWFNIFLKFCCIPAYLIFCIFYKKDSKEKLGFCH